MMPERLLKPLPLLTSILLAFAAGTVISVESGRFMDRLDAVAKDREPVTNWIVVHELQVPDFRIGENPDVSLSRAIFRDLTGRWSVEVHDENGRQVCPKGEGGTGRANYTVSEAGTIRMPFERYTAGCVITKAGRHRVTVLIRFSDGSPTPDKSMSFQSNWFYVTD